MDFLRRRADILCGLPLLIIAAGISYLFISQTDQHLDTSYITYRYVENLLNGQGFVYNPGERILIHSVSPLYVQMIATASPLQSDIPLLASIISAVGVGLSALLLYLTVLTAQQPSSPLTALAAALILIGFPLLWFSLGTEVGLWLAFSLMALWLHLKDWSTPAAAALALAVLIRPEAAVLGAVFIADSLLAQEDGFRPAPLIIFASIVGIGLVWGLITFDVGGPLPALNGVAANLVPPTGVLSAVTSLSWLWLALLILAVVGIFSLALDFTPGTPPPNRWALVLTGWALLHTITLAFLPTAITPLSLAPVLAAWAGLAALGAQWIAMRFAPDESNKAPLTDRRSYFQWGVVGIAALLIAVPAVESILKVASNAAGQWTALRPPLVDMSPQQAGQWISTSTSPEAVVGTTQTGVFGYYADRYLLDYYGTLQPDLAEAYQRRDGSWWLGYYAPDYLVLSTSEAATLGTYRPTADPWFAITYTQAEQIGDLVIYQRVATPDPLHEEVVGLVEYPDGLTLNGRIATNFSLDPLDSGMVGRVQLNWLLDGTPPPRHVAIRIQGRGENPPLIAINGRDIDFSTWPQRRLIDTYHTLEIGPSIPPGVYDVAVGIGPDPFNLEWQTVTQAKVPFPEANVLGGFSGTRAEFGEIVLLGYRLARNEEGLQVSLNWQAAERPLTDYRVLLQVRDESGVVLASVETEPHGGAYPTSVWSAGERVPDVYIINDDTIPPGDYSVYAGLVDENGDRLRTLGGLDSVFVGRVNIPAPE